MKIVTYNQQIRNYDGTIYTVQHKCEILNFVGNEFVKIKIYGSIYKGKANATPTVKRKSIIELKNHTYHE